MSKRPTPAADAPLAVVYRPLAIIADDPKNARTHAPEQLRQLAKLLAVRWTNPILIDEHDQIIAGHARKAAGLLAGLVDAPCIVIAGLSASERRALVLADNAIALQSGWNLDLLRSELTDLKAAGLDMTLTGFAATDLVSLFARSKGRTDPDDAPPAPSVPVSRLGDVWLLGPHRLCCGDSTVPRDVARAVGDLRPFLMVTDPPYGVEYDPAWRERNFGEGGRAVGQVTNDGRADWSRAWSLFEGDVAYVWHSMLHEGTVSETLRRAGFDIRAQIVWVKTRFAIGRGNYHAQHEAAWFAQRNSSADDHWRYVDEHEPAAYAVRKGARADWQGGRKQTTVWMIEHIKSETGHGTQKPVECMRRPMDNNTHAGDAVYDPFMGAGTSIIAAEMAGRACVGLEIDPVYVDVAVLRWQAFTGQAAVHEADGVTFARASDDRLGAPPAEPVAPRRRRVAA